MMLAAGIVLFAAASSPSATAAAELSGTMGISVADFGAVGDGHKDDAAALQAGIDAAQARGRALLVPAGTYITSKMLLIRLDLKANLSSQPLRLVGEGPHRSSIVHRQ